MSAGNLDRFVIGIAWSSWHHVVMVTCLRNMTAELVVDYWLLHSWGVQ